jgi:hypothetical protein
VRLLDGELNEDRAMAREITCIIRDGDEHDNHLDGVGGTWGSKGAHGDRRDRIRRRLLLEVDGALVDVIALAAGLSLALCSSSMLRCGTSWTQYTKACIAIQSARLLACQNVLRRITQSLVREIQNAALT